MSGDTASCGCGTCAGVASVGAASDIPGQRGLTAPERSHSAFKTRLVHAVESAPELSALSAEASDDATIALIDAWASSLHVLSFYLERYQAESFIDTAVEPESVDGLARMVGYQPAPALSAATTLAFTVDDTPGAAPIVVLPASVKVQSLPRHGETPVVFETAAGLEARPIWNELSVQRLEVPLLHAADTALRVREITLKARPGDVIAVIKAKAGGFDYATARLDTFEPKLPPQEVHPHQLLGLDGAWSGNPPAGFDSIAIFSRRAAPFGYNAPTFRLLSDDVRGRIVKDANVADPVDKVMEWPNLRAYYFVGAVAAPTNQIDLDAVYPEAYRNRHVLLSQGAKQELFKIASVDEVARTSFGVTSRVSRLTLDRALTNFSADSDARTTSVLIETEQVTLAEVPITPLAPADATPDRITFAQACPLPAGRLVVLRGLGRRADQPNDPLTACSEVACVKAMTGGDRVVVFLAALNNRYDPQTLVLLGNAVGASHGETKMQPRPLDGTSAGFVPEIIGSGDARVPHQAFALRQPGLTYLSAANAVGFAPELEVRVDDVIRPRVESLFGLGDADRSYAVEAAYQTNARVRFAGRLRTGSDNVTAVYRVGGGAAGNLDVDRLTLPLTMPPGLRSVTNPVLASGGAAEEGLESARANAPIRVVTLDRIVSLGDYAAFARAFGGISQAQASLVWNGRRQTVHVTVAGPDGANVPVGSDLYNFLVRAMRAASAPGRPFGLFGYTLRAFGVTLALLIDPAHDHDAVERAVREALNSAFAPAARRFGAPVAKSHLAAAAQGVEGVIAARVDQLVDAQNNIVAGEVLGASTASATAGAELLALDPQGLVLTRMGP